MQNTITYNERGDVQSFTGTAVEVFRAATIASALRLYARTGMKANRAYTPKNMMAAARQILGDTAGTIGARDYLGMADKLSVWVQAEKARYAAEAQTRDALTQGGK